MPFRDIREFIAGLEKEGEAERIEEEVDWNLEAGAMIRRSNEMGLPAPFIQKVKGYPEGCRLFGEALGNHRRVAIAMEVDANTPARKLIEEYLRRKTRQIKPRIVDGGPCKENVQIGDEVDLLAFPVPMVHDGDGGRFIGTWHIDISKDPDTGWVNWGEYRHMLHSKNSMGIEAGPHTHLGSMYQKCEASGKPLEIAIVMGAEPVSQFCAVSPTPFGVFEADVAGGIRGEPVELTKCETIDLMVPATAEIVIEGEIKPFERMDEGPFGEYTGYSAAHVLPRPVIHVKAVTFRNNPVFTMTCVGMPLAESPVNMSISWAGMFLEVLKARGLPVTGVSLPAELSGVLVVVAVKTTSANMATEIAHVIWGTQKGRSIPYLVVVNDDVDPFDVTKVFHTLATKCHPSRGIIKLEQQVSTVFMPWANEYEQKYRVGSKTYFDCTWPLDWAPQNVPKKISFSDSYPSEVQQRVLEIWRKHGY
jgi:phenylphosphate carboxylase alpha subunit